MKVLGPIARKLGIDEMLSVFNLLSPSKDLTSSVLIGLLFKFRFSKCMACCSSSGMNSNRFPERIKIFRDGSALNNPLGIEVKLVSAKFKVLKQI